MPQASKSIFDLPKPQSNAENVNLAHEPQVRPEASSKTPYQDDASSVFSQSTIASTISPEMSNSKGRFSFLGRSKSSSKDDTKGLLADPNSAKKKSSSFSSRFKPHEPTEKDLEIAQRIRERLGSREEAIRWGGSQPAGNKGMNGGHGMGGPWCA